MRRQERKELKEHNVKVEKLIEDINEFGEFFRYKPIGFETLPMLVLGQNFLNSLRIYIHKNKEKLKYKPRRKKSEKRIRRR